LIRISPQAGNRALIDDALGHRREALNWRYEVQHLQTAVGMVCADIGIAVVPNMAVSPRAISGLVAVPLRNPSVSRTVGIVTRRDQPIAPPVQALIDLLRHYFQKIG
jgi:DNA-binding transcriptional LysR family regulator